MNNKRFAQARSVVSHCTKGAAAVVLLPMSGASASTCAIGRASIACFESGGILLNAVAAKIRQCCLRQMNAQQSLAIGTPMGVKP